VDRPADDGFQRITADVLSEGVAETATEAIIRIHLNSIVIHAGI
jgi:hypothetical protein